MLDTGDIANMAIGPYNAPPGRSFWGVSWSWYTGTVASEFEALAELFSSARFAAAVGEFALTSCCIIGARMKRRLFEALIRAFRVDVKTDSVMPSPFALSRGLPLRRSLPAQWQMLFLSVRRGEFVALNHGYFGWHA